MISLLVIIKLKKKIHFIQDFPLIEVKQQINYYY